MKGRCGEIVRGDELQVLGLSKERTQRRDEWWVLCFTKEGIQGQTHRGVFNTAHLFKQKLGFIETEVITNQQTTLNETEGGSLNKQSSAWSP
jgi:hypothetical protein